ncbi:aldo/keto reductase [Goodfellowiella coeruleoviolacea]|uniref:Oxidoreductase n=1 Tax=Goodfellowiella coeruleoviolacea TaxID=334858 RepID=A0AAE3GHN4_9PSEU|nr:aldo/keto reductase [Goodfellowiella coeruleoviolacea]MCP2168407.1 putative oxidoreductase [Goodfellowiella coeruleoviolacea]
MNATTVNSRTAEVVALGGDLPVRRIGFGAMRLADGPDSPRGQAAHIWRAPADRAGAVAVLRRAVELGVDLIDTADAYALGASEELVAEALHPYRDNVVIATKVGVVRPSPTEWSVLGHPDYLRQQAELSLRRLRVERLDLLQLHRVDPNVPLADQIGALRQLQEQGKVRHVGLSEVTVDQLRQAAEITPIASVQNMYNLASRQHDDVVDYAAEHGIAFLPFFPIAMGEHAGPDSPVAAIAREVGATPAQVALAWLLHRAPTVIPIPGTSSPAHLAENVGALRVELTDDQVRRLTAATSAPEGNARP